MRLAATDSPLLSAAVSLPGVGRNRLDTGTGMHSYTFVLAPAFKKVAGCLIQHPRHHTIAHLDDRQLALATNASRIMQPIKPAPMSKTFAPGSNS